MSRPEPKIIAEQELASGDSCQILEAKANYLIRYKKEIVAIRVVGHGLGTLKRKYKKMSYSHEGSVKAQVRKLNETFDCCDFDYIKIT